jgi:hypothetical protein
LKRYTIDCRQVGTFAEFVEAANAGLIRPAGGQWDGNLDAFNDYLAWPEDDEYELEVEDAGRCRAALGHEAMAEWLRQKLHGCHPTARPSIEKRLADAERGQGLTLFDTLREIITDNTHVRLVLT